MKFLYCFAICCILATSIQANVIIIEGLGDEPFVKERMVRWYTNQNHLDKFNNKASLATKETVNASSNGSVQQSVDPAPPPFPRPEVSSGVLINTFHLMYKKINIFPNDIHDNRTVLIRNVYSGKCLAMKVDADGDFTKAIETSCTENGNQKNTLVHLVHVGDGYVSLRLAQKYCIGAGYDPWSYAYVSNSDAWCKESHSHHWAIVQRGNHVIFKLRETNRCLTSWPKWEELFVDNNDCKLHDPYQEYQICDQTATNCWPPNAQ